MYSVQLQMIRTVLEWYWGVSPWSEENVHCPDEAGLLLENIRISAIDHTQNSKTLFNIQLEVKNCICLKGVKKIGLNICKCLMTSLKHKVVLTAFSPCPVGLGQFAYFGSKTYFCDMKMGKIKGKQTQISTNKINYKNTRALARYVCKHLQINLKRHFKWH